MSIILEVSNLGPLRSARVELADFTLLIGENNTGKTFFATVVHRVLVAARAEPWRRGLVSEKEVPVEVLDWLEAGLAADGDETADGDGRERGAPDAVTQWASDYTTARLRAFGVSAREGVEYAYGADASDLRRRTATRRSGDCFLRVRNAEPAWEVEVRFDSDDVEVNPPDPRVWLELLIGDERARRDSLAARERSRAGPRRSAARRFPPGWPWYWGARDGLFRDWPRSPVHLPANRTGFMLSYQVLAAELVRQSASVGIRPIEVNPLPGTSADFLALLLSDAENGLTDRREDPRFRSLLNELENDLRAEIALRERAAGLDSVVAVTPEGEYPLSRVSSMLSELAPIVLVLKGTLGPCDHLTIDEPEAHLHPAMQRTVASFLAGVADRGAGVVVTTHSDFFLGEINNLIRSGKLADAWAPGPQNGNSASPKPTVCALRFAREERWCIGRQLSLDCVDGIDESTFTEVMESLYDESARLINELL
ncbi:MAG: AAA family ATPase [Gemmatimonadota bacterium]|nr:AAA family ATPase [Gemmatimonadota bacterium]